MQSTLRESNQEDLNKVRSELVLNSTVSEGKSPAINVSVDQPPVVANYLEEKMDTSNRGAFNGTVIVEEDKLSPSSNAKKQTSFRDQLTQHQQEIALRR